MRHLSLHVLASMLTLILILSACSQTSASVTTQISHNITEYPLPQANSGIMRPVVDHEGRIWFGEMGHNALAYFDSTTQTFTQMTPPQGAGGIMGIAVAKDNSIWFSEQNANYIGKYQPATQHYTLYHLPDRHIPDPTTKNHTLDMPAAPNDLVIDTQGNVWFTEMNIDAVGEIKAQTGEIVQYPLIAQEANPTINPYGITIDSQGILWITAANNNRLWRLDPIHHNVSSFLLPGNKNPMMEIQSANHLLWITTFDTALLVQFNTETQQFSSYQVPGSTTETGGLYGITSNEDGNIWVTVPSENALASFNIKSHTFILYQIPTSQSSPFGIIEGPNKTLWFTETVGNQIGNLKLTGT